MPMTALLNHSCNPNCLLRFVLKPGDTPLLQLISSRPLSLHEPLTHSYTDTTQSTDRRRHHLNHNYDFICNCSRCEHSPSLSLPLSWIPSPSLSPSLSLSPHILVGDKEKEVNATPVATPIYDPHITHSYPVTTAAAATTAATSSSSPSSSAYVQAAAIRPSPSLSLPGNPSPSPSSSSPSPSSSFTPSAPTHRSILVLVPEGYVSGNTFAVTSPENIVITVTVPSGATAGETIRVPY